MKLWTCLLIMIWIFPGAAAAVGETGGKMNTEIPLPDQMAGWKWDGKEERHDAKTVFGYMDGAAELYLAYGFEGLTVRRYEKPGSPPLTVELYGMASPEDAYGIFTFERQDESAGIGQGSEFGGGMLRFWKGRHFASIYAEGEGADVEGALLMMARAVADALPAGPEPALIGFIPGKAFGLIESSVRLVRSHVLLNQRFFIAHRNILNLNRQTRAVLAQYLQEPSKTQLLVIQYPDPQAAGEAYRSFMGAYLPEAAGKDRLKTDDQRWTLARHRGQWVLIVFGAPTEAAAERLAIAAEEKLPKGG